MTSLSEANTVELAEMLRSVFRRLPAPVFILSSAMGDEPYAMAATAVTPLSMAPPSVLVCINRSSSIFQAVMAGAGFCINVLMPHHEPLASACSGGAARHDRFREGGFALGDDGPPFIPDALANIFCRQDGRYLYGTHAIVIGKVHRVAAHEPARPSLLYCDGRFQTMPSRGDTPGEV